MNASVLMRCQAGAFGFLGRIQKHPLHLSQQFPRERSFVGVGHPHVDILRHVEERQIDLLILGLRRNAHLGMQNRTSGAFPIIVEAKCPVITVASGSTHHP
jgi:Universal stress protein family